MKIIFSTIVIFSLIVFQGIAQINVDLQVVQKIKKEAMQNSEVMEVTEYICDVYGPRLTASPQYLKAANWVVEKMKKWGIEESYIDSWGTFGRGWQVEKVSAEMIEPTYMPLIVYPKSWTGSTNGIIIGKPIFVENKTYEELEKLKGQLEGEIILFGKPRKADIHFVPDAKRLNEEKLTEIQQAKDPDKILPITERKEKWRKYKENRLKINKFFAEEKVGAVLEYSDREHGTIRVHRGGSYKIGDTFGPAFLVVSIEQYSRIWRTIKKNIDVKLQVEVKNNFFENDSLGKNIIAEIPGKDRNLKNEIVMLGAHFDSWHAGTGATDNGANCAVMMEAMRIIKHLNLNNKRTIRLGLWDGEEQGYLGSEGYINKYIGNLETLEIKKEHKNISAYLNLDNGAGKIRGIYLQENDAARPIFESLLHPFNDMGVQTITIRRTSGTDHIPFNNIGLPGLQFIQDPINYMTRTHHTNMDVVDNVIESDLIHNAIVIASVVYHIANMPNKIPRKQMPTLEEKEKFGW